MNSLSAHIEVVGEDVVVTGTSGLFGRRERRFFQAILGGSHVDDGWRIPIRGNRVQDVVVRVNSFLEDQGFRIGRGEVAERGVDLALERRRSLERAREEATRWRSGLSDIDSKQIEARLLSLGWKPERRLKSHQLRNVCHALAAVNQANFSVPGAGKTVTALAAALMHYVSNTVDTIMVVGPLSSFGPWESETKAAVGESLRVVRLRGSAYSRRQLYEEAVRGDLLLLSYAVAASDRLAIKAMCQQLNVMLIVDESHRIKRFRGGVWAPALAEIAQLARVRMILSGTPMPNGPRDLYSQINVMWPEGLLTGSRTAFEARTERGFASVLRSVSPFMIRTSKAELGLPEYRVQRHQVPITGTQAEVYELIMRRLRDRLNDAGTWEDKIDALRRGRPIRLLQAASNPDLLNHRDDAFRIPPVPQTNPTLMTRLALFNDTERPAKSMVALDIVRNIAAEGSKVVCWSNFVRNLDSFNTLVRQELGIPVFQVDGRVPASDDPTQDGHGESTNEDDTRERRIARFLTCDGPAVLVTNPATSSESISLHRACHQAIYLDRSYDAALFLQSIDRIHRLGLPDDAEVTVHILQAGIGDGDTVDHLVDASLIGKQSAMEELLGGAEVQPLHQDGVDPEGNREDLEMLLRYLIGEDIQT